MPYHITSVRNPFTYSFSFQESSTLLICGGAIQDNINGDIHTSNECYLLDKYSANLVWLMEEKRAFAAGLNIDDNFYWITGGIEYDSGKILSSTEYILKVRNIMWLL